MSVARSPGRSRRTTMMAVGVVALAAAIAAPAVSAAPKTKLFSKSTSGVQGDMDSSNTQTSGNGRYTVFLSFSDKLVPNDNNDKSDVFVHDKKTKTTTRVSVTSLGVEATGDSWQPSISANGRYVAFSSDAEDLVDDDDNEFRDVFLHDRKHKTTKRISEKTGGAQADELSELPSLSADGRFIAFNSFATNLVNNDDNGSHDVFVYDRKKKTTRRVSKRSNGAEGKNDSVDARISANGRFVVFASTAGNLVKKDNNGESDIFVHDRRTKKTKRVSVKSNGKEANGSSSDPVISADGMTIAFQSEATNLFGNDRTGSSNDIYVHNRATKRTKRVSNNSRGKQAKGSSRGPSISANGRWVTFMSSASNLVNNDTNGEQDVFLHDRKTRKTKRISVKTGGGQVSKGGRDGFISDDGRWVVFESTAEDLTGADSNTKNDVFGRGPLR